MPNILLTEFTGEGDTDRRFLGPIIERTLERLLLESDGQIDCYPPNWRGVAKGLQIAEHAKSGSQNDLTLYCAHVDEDRNGHVKTMEYQIAPAIKQLADEGCAHLPIVPVVPKEETEAWMLADVEALRQSLGTTLTAAQLELHGNPERYADPKQKLRQVIAIANQGKGSHLQVEINELYDILGVDASLDVLQGLESYVRFKSAARNGLVAIGYLQAQ